MFETFVIAAEDLDTDEDVENAKWTEFATKLSSTKLRKD